MTLVSVCVFFSISRLSPDLCTVQWRMNCTEDVIQNRVLQFRMPLFPGFYGKCNKGRYWANKCKSIRNIPGYSLHFGNSMRVLWKDPMLNLCQSFPVNVEEPPSLNNQRTYCILKKHTALDNRPAMEKRIKNSGETIECIFCLLYTNDAAAD